MAEGADADSDPAAEVRDLPGIDPTTGRPRKFFYAPNLLVVDGGNWLRRDFAMPPFRGINEQLEGR